MYKLVSEVIRLLLYILKLRAKSAYFNVVTVFSRHKRFRLTYLEFNVFYLNIFFFNCKIQPN